MSVEPIGLFIVALGFTCMLLSVRVSLFALALTALLGAAAALILGSSGQVQPAHLLLAFVVPTVLCRRTALAAALNSLVFPQAGFWLAFIVAFGIAGAVLLPRVFAGSTQINSIGQSEVGTAITMIPLAPVGGNLTQSIYLTADLACFLTVVGASALDGGIMTTTKAMVAFSVGNVIFACLDLGTFYTDTSFLLDPIRNAHYVFHTEELSNGLKRIAGSFTETSTFSTVTLGSIGFIGTLWLHGRWTLLTGGLTIVSIVLVILSTSSTGLIGCPLVVGLLYITALSRVWKEKNSTMSSVFVVAAPILAISAMAFLSFAPTASDLVDNYVNSLLFAKSLSQSGVERAAWNNMALVNFVDTYGLGAGLGSVRASSFMVAVASNLGVVGVILFSAFFWQALLRAGNGKGQSADFSIAARNGCISLLIAATISGALVDLGLQFFFLAGLASTGTSRDITPRSGLDRQVDSMYHVASREYAA